MSALVFNPLCCILCGGLICRESQNLPQWMHKFRAIYTVNDAYDKASVSAMGIRRQGHHTLRSEYHTGIWWPQDDPSLEGYSGTGNNGGMGRDISLNWSPHNTRLRDEDRGGIFWGFPLHSACWNLLTTLRPYGLLDTQAIFDICRSFPPRGGVLLFGHDYGGICEPDPMFVTYPGEKPQRILHKPLGFEPLLNETLHSPLNIHDVGKIFEEEHADYGGHRSTNFLVMGGSTENDPFSAVPFEILELIVVNLTLEDVSKLKTGVSNFRQTSLI